MKIKEFLGSTVLDKNAYEVGKVGDVDYLRPRFSPGYGDLPLALQADVFWALDCTSKIGVSLSESLIMSPQKSVTAIIGISEKEILE